MIHEDAKTEKIKTRLLAMVSDSPGLRWQRDDQEIKEVTNHLEEEPTKCKFKINEGIVRTMKNKIWIPKSRRKEFILEMHKNLCHAGTKKVMDYIKTGYDMEYMQKHN